MKKMIWSVISNNNVCRLNLWAISQLNRCDLSVGILNIIMTALALAFTILPLSILPGWVPVVSSIDYMNVVSWINGVSNRLVNRLFRYSYSQASSR